MWAKLKSLNKTTKGGEELQAVHGSSNVNEEYLSAFKTKSYADFQIKAQLLVNRPSSSSTFNYSEISDFLLEPGQEAIASILEKSKLSKKSKLKGLLHNYFSISAEASNICSHLLTSINKVQSNYKFIQRALDTAGDDHSSPNHLKFVSSELKSFNLLKNPFADPNNYDFKLIHDRYSSVLQHLKSKRKHIAKKVKILNCCKHASGACITVACGAAATVLLIVAAHTFCGLLMGPAIVSFTMKQNFNFRFLRSRVLKEVGKQLDVAARGAYILNRDFDTMSRLVARLFDEIEHSRAMIQFCLDRNDDKFSFQEVVKELRKSDSGFRKQLEDLEEHVYLCLVTINRARALVIKEMTVPSEA
ncbi:hypothetical protein AQUCO_01400395v1 [Aquilegia coerulea]|uniref:Uncharacterized protein n=1 Tax=Aquilegia coerulea TaxID=218851 RepID=A0A2G5DW62_AQUCA|nr:hypothetical protein AQUCO_01400395v1 [Aquilegia coerulea]